jgi:hypothetical protein
MNLDTRNRDRHIPRVEVHSARRGFSILPLWENRGLSYVRIQLLGSTVGRQSMGKSLSRMYKSSFLFFITLTYSSVCC